MSEENQNQINEPLEQRQDAAPDEQAPVEQPAVVIEQPAPIEQTPAQEPAAQEPLPAAATEPAMAAPAPAEAARPPSLISDLLLRAKEKIQFHCSDATATRYLSQLVKEGALARGGKARKPFYHLAN